MIRKTIYGTEYSLEQPKKLSDDQVRLIRAVRGSDKLIAKAFGVSSSTINAIRNFKMRRSVK